MATVHVGSVWNLQYWLRSSVPIKRMSQNFYPGDLRSGQFRDLPIISLRGDMKTLPVSHKLTETTQFFQDHEHSPHLWWSGCNWWSGVTGRSSEVTWGHNPFFANNSRQGGDRDERMVPNGFARRAASLRKIYIDLHGLWPDLDLTWPEVRFWNWIFKNVQFSIETEFEKLSCIKKKRFTLLSYDLGSAKEGSAKHVGPLSHPPDLSRLTKDCFSISQWSWRFVGVLEAFSASLPSSQKRCRVPISLLSQSSEYCGQRFFFLYRKSRSNIVTLKLNPLAQAESVRAISVRMKNTSTKCTPWLLTLSQMVITIIEWWDSIVKWFMASTSLFMSVHRKSYLQNISIFRF